MQPDNRRAYIFLAGFIVVLVIVIVILFAYFKSKQPSASNSASTTYYDSRSGQTVSSPAGKTPEIYGTGSQPVYLGISDLFPIGVSQYQVNDLKSALTAYSSSSKQNVTEFSITVSSIKLEPHDPNLTGDNNTVDFDITMNRKNTYQAKFNYYGLSTARLYLYNNQQLIYDSNPVDVTTD
ncbi:MAG: hypothetical protein ACHQUB_01205 [Candidatus Saccharimonadia bacterium]